MHMIKKIFRTIKNILFPKVYMPWEQPGITDLSSAELQELIALIDAHLAELDEVVHIKRIQSKPMSIDKTLRFTQSRGFFIS